MINRTYAKGPIQGPVQAGEAPLMSGSKQLLSGTLASALSAGVGGGVLGAAGALGHNMMVPEDKAVDPVGAMMKLGLPFALAGATLHLGGAAHRALSNKIRG